MNWTKLFAMQEKLDARIIREHDLTDKDLIEEKMLALLVELAELANETRAFKFWSKKPAADQAVILEEYVDSIHFILSLGLTLRLTDVTISVNKPVHGTIVQQFLTVFDKINTFQTQHTQAQYNSLVTEYLVLGEMLGFSEANIEQAYRNKNEVNHQRQDEGY